MNKYHYEYRIRCLNLCYGGVSYGPFRTLNEAKYKIAMQSAIQGPHWAIEKFRVYE